MRRLCDLWKDIKDWVIDWVELLFFHENEDLEYAKSFAPEFEKYKKKE
jgi:hypothetical protein